MNTHTIFIKNRPFVAISDKTKTVEVRANKKVGTLDYSKILVNDLVIFIDQETSNRVTCKIERVTHYWDLRMLLIQEGVENTLSSGGDVDSGVKSIESTTDYKKVIKKSGVFAFKLEVIK